jgi:hypothetical protein
MIENATGVERRLNMHGGCNGFIDRETAKQLHKKSAQNRDIHNPQNDTMV